MTNSSSAEKGAATDAQGKKRPFLADVVKPVKPVVTSGEFDPDEMQTVPVLVPVDQCQSRKLDLLTSICSILVCYLFILSLF